MQWWSFSFIFYAVSLKLNLAKAYMQVHLCRSILWNSLSHLVTSLILEYIPMTSLVLELFLWHQKHSVLSHLFLRYRATRRNRKSQLSLTCVQLCAAYIHSTQYINSPDKSNKLSTGIGHIIVFNTSDSESDNQPFSNNKIQKSDYNEDTNWISSNIKSPLVCRSPVSPTLCRVCLRHRHKKKREARLLQ
jgi:hypothetical protein